MKVRSDPRRFMATALGAVEKAANDTLGDIHMRQVRRTGRLANSERLVQTREGRWVITSDVVYARAVETGVNAREKASVKKGTKARAITVFQNGRYKRIGYVAGPLLNRKTRRGPHMKGNHIIVDTAPRFIDHANQRMREAFR